MPRITELKPQKNRTDRYNLYLDEVYKFPVSANTVLTAGLHVGMEIDEDELEQIRQTAEVGNAHDKALSYLDLRRRSVKELRDYLRRKEYESETIDKVIDRLINANLLNDEEFARAWVRDRLLLKPKSKRALSVELAQKGINRTIVDSVLGEMEEGSEQQALKEAINRKLRQSKYTNRENDDKLIAALMRDGYQYADIRSCLLQRDDT